MDGLSSKWETALSISRKLIHCLHAHWPRQNPVLRMLVAKHPELFDKSAEELERELDAKFDKTIK